MKKGFIAILGIFIFILTLTEAASAQQQTPRRKKKKAGKERTIYEIDTLIKPIPLYRQKFHDDVAKSLRGADAGDGVRDNYIWFGDDTLASQILTNSILRDAGHIDTMIENLPYPTLEVEKKAKLNFLRALNKLLTRYNRDTKVDPYFYRKLVTNQRDMIIASHQGKIKEFARENANVYTLANIDLLQEFPEEKAFVFSEVGKQEPLMMIKRLSEFANEPYAGDIIAAAAKKDPKLIYNYASSTNTKLNGAVRRTTDPLVQTIVRITSESRSPLKAMSFLSDIHTQKLTIAEVDKITSNEDLFYKNLVRLKLEQQELGDESITQELAYRGMKYVREINRLHDNPNPAVRFKSIEPLTAEELYFMMVYGQDEIYTSSFVNSYNKMIERMKPAKGDELLDKVHYEHFRTFLRMSAGYNTLNAFLKTMEADKKTALMKKFVSGLENGKEDDLEDAVDVADAFASVDDTALSDFLMAEVRTNYERVAAEKNKKGLVVYGLLAAIFKDMRSSGGSDGTTVGIEPVTYVPYDKLKSDSGVVYVQFYFYGDEDGKASYYNSFKPSMEREGWKFTVNKQWATLTKPGAKPMIIYANLPLMETEEAAEEAQAALNKELASKEIIPTIIVHRGHSYHLSSTLEHLTRKTRIVMLGSCGGYHNLGTILDASPSAHIVSTKQTGTMLVNDAILGGMDKMILSGEDVNWVTLWHDMEKKFTSPKGPLAGYKEFKDYVPPFRNLGAIFIKAYRRISNADAVEEE